MADIYVRLAYDPTGRNPDNLITGERHTLAAITGFPYKITDMVNGGFYAKSVRVYDADYNRLILNTDYILTYKYAKISDSLGLEVCSDIVFLDKTRVGLIFISAQMVGGDEAFSLTAVDDYITWFNQQPAGYVPRQLDYSGNQPEWLPGELDKERWRLDTYQPFNNEIYQIARAHLGGNGKSEDAFRNKIQDKYNSFLNQFTNRLQSHIDNTQNPHGSNKNMIGLGNVQNYPLATDAQARAGVSNVLYQTPALTWATMDTVAYSPLISHINNTQNPHRLTADLIGAPSKALVDQTIAGKYLRTEKVVNADTFTDSVTNYTYYDYFNYARDKIPAANFAYGGLNGLMIPSRIGRGTPNSNSVLFSNSGAWVDWSAFMQQYSSADSADLKIMSFAVGTTPAQAHSLAISDPWASTAHVGSVILYRCRIDYEWRYGNGQTHINYDVVYGSYKTSAGWISL